MRLAEYANIVMKELFLLKLIKSFIEAHDSIRPALWVFTTVRSPGGLGTRVGRGQRGAESPRPPCAEPREKSPAAAPRRAGLSCTPGCLCRRPLAPVSPNPHKAGRCEGPCPPRAAPRKHRGN